MNEQDCRAILDWFGIQGGERDRLNKQIDENPLLFFDEHLHLLPQHLLALLGKRLSIEQRGTIAQVRHRRRRWATMEQPEELDLEEARQREPLLYRDIVGSVRHDGRSQYAVPTQYGRSNGTSVGPLSNNHIASTIISPEQVLSQPRFAALMHRFDEEETAETLQRQGEIRNETVAEVEEEEEEEKEEEEEDGDEGEECAEGESVGDAENEFRQMILDRYIRGESSLPERLYTCDYDERWDEQATSGERRRGFMRAIDSEECWFDDEQPS